MQPSSAYLLAKQKLARYCSYQERNRKEVQQKLAAYKDLSPAEIQQIIQELIQERFLDEGRYLTAFVNGKFHLNKWGKTKIYHSLLGTGIDPKLIQEALDQIPAQAYIATLRQLVHKKKTSLCGQADAVIQKKVINYLLQKGYELTLIQESLKDLLQQEDH
jgi:regulatory protein